MGSDASQWWITLSLLGLSTLVSLRIGYALVRASLRARREARPASSPARAATTQAPAPG